MSVRVGQSSWHRNKRYGVDFVKPSRTKQEWTEECDINVLMKRFEKTGVLSHVARTPPRYLDLTSVPDLQSAMNTMSEAREAFMHLPAAIRATFDNDPVAFVDFASKPENIEQMRKWKLAPEPEVEAPPQRVEIVGDRRQKPPRAAESAANGGDE